MKKKAINIYVLSAIDWFVIIGIGGEVEREQIMIRKGRGNEFNDLDDVWNPAYITLWEDRKMDRDRALYLKDCLLTAIIVAGILDELLSGSMELDKVKFIAEFDSKLVANHLGGLTNVQASDIMPV